MSRRTHSPKIEMLEDRFCPAVDAFLTAGTLEVRTAEVAHIQPEMVRTVEMQIIDNVSVGDSFKGEADPPEPDLTARKGEADPPDPDLTAHKGETDPPDPDLVARDAEADPPTEINALIGLLHDADSDPPGETNTRDADPPGEINTGDADPPGETNTLIGLLREVKV